MVFLLHTIWQIGADIYWHGKRFDVVSGVNCPGKDCGAKGVIFNYLGAGPLQVGGSCGKIQPQAICSATMHSYYLYHNIYYCK